MDSISQVQEFHNNSTRKPTAPNLKHFLVVFAIPLVVLIAGIYLLSIATLIGLMMVIVAIAIMAGILMAAIRITYQNNLDAEPARWKTKTFPLTSLILVIGVPILIFFMFARQ